MLRVYGPLGTAKTGTYIPPAVTASSDVFTSFLDTSAGSLSLGGAQLQQQGVGTLTLAGNVQLQTQGAGTLTLGGNLTNTGGNTLSGGTLNVGGISGTGTNNATIGGQGTIGTVGSQIGGSSTPAQ